jgi:hypothetical protein
MTYTKTYNIDQNNQLIINLPDQFKRTRKVRVIIEDIDSEMENKINMLKKASEDPLFLADIEEILADFKNIDNESV